MKNEKNDKKNKFVSNSSRMKKSKYKEKMLLHQMEDIP